MEIKRIKCFLKRHNFRVIGRQSLGMTLERRFECKNCKLFLISNIIHPDYEIKNDPFKALAIDEYIYYRMSRVRRVIKEKRTIIKRLNYFERL